VATGVHSPTFVLHHHYQGRVPIEHYDLYRLDGMAWVDSGLDEPAPDAVTVIEWPDRAGVLDDWATIRIGLTSKAETRRRLTFLRGPDRIRAVFRAPGDRHLRRGPGAGRPRRAPPPRRRRLGQ